MDHTKRARLLRLILATVFFPVIACNPKTSDPLPEYEPHECLPDERAIPILTTDAGIDYVRTPEIHFETLEDFPFEPHYVTIDGLRMHYVDEGPADGEIVLMLHGEPSWSYLYRKMIPIIAAAGYRAIAVDHMGMGRSDKPIDPTLHTYNQEIEWIRKFIEGANLTDITLFCQDWGGLIGLRIAGDTPDLFARIVVANSRLPVLPPNFNPFTMPEDISVDCDLKGAVEEVFGKEYPSHLERFQAWLTYALKAPNLMASEILELGTLIDITPQAVAAYDAPYPSYIYKAAIRAFPSMITAVYDDNAPAWEELGRFEKPFLTIAGTEDKNLGSEAVQNEMINHIPGAEGQAHDRIEAAHFIQEDAGEILGQKVVDFIVANPLP